MTITDVDRNQSKTVTTSTQGAYRLDFLLTGNYAVSTSAGDFKTYRQTGITLNAREAATIDVILTTGDVTESVEVTSYSNPGNTVNSATFGVVSSANPMRQVQLGAKVNF